MKNILKYDISKGMTYTTKCVNMLALKGASSIEADDILNYSYYFSEKIGLTLPVNCLAE